MELYREQPRNACRQVEMPLSAALWLKQKKLDQLVGLEGMRVPAPSDHDESATVTVDLTGLDSALDKAEAAIREFTQRSPNEIQRRVLVPDNLRGLIVGNKWTRWPEIVNRCGGPEDPLQQRLMIDL
jgi:hypothetical protein